MTSLPGAFVGLVAGYLATTQILVNGTLTDLGTRLITTGNGYNSFTLIQVNSVAN